MFLTFWLILMVAAIWASIYGKAEAQSNPGLVNGQIPTAAQWNSFFAAKQDLVNGALTGPGAAVAGHMVTWGTTYPATADGGAVPTVAAGTCMGVTGNPAYVVALSSACQAPRNFISALALSTGGNTFFSVTAGAAMDSTNAVLMTNGSALAKSTSAWASGNNNGCLDTGTIANSTWYHIFLIERTDKSATDILCSLSTTPTMPTNYSFYRRIGSMATTGAGNWIQVVQFGDDFYWANPINNVSTTTLGTTPTSYSISVPPGVVVRAKVRGVMSSVTPGTGVVIVSPSFATPTAGSPVGEETAVAQVNGIAVAFTLDGILTDTAQHIQAVASAASTTLKVDTYGWTDRRGQDN